MRQVQFSAASGLRGTASSSFPSSHQGYQGNMMSCRTFALPTLMRAKRETASFRFFDNVTAFAAASLVGHGLRTTIQKPLIQRRAVKQPTSTTQFRSSSSSSSSSSSGVHVITACNAYRQETAVLERSAIANGFNFRAVGIGEPFRGVGTKLVLYDRALKDLVGKEIPPDDVVMLLDAWDTVILGTAQELHQKLDRLGMLESSGSILCGADRICCPEFKMAPKMERYFPDIRTPWKYPNSGGIAGPATTVQMFLHHLVHGPESGGFSEGDDDQLRIQNFILACKEDGNPFPFSLDDRCSVFQNMGEPECGWDYEQASGADEGPRIRNRTTGERPIVVHGCGGHGRWFLADVYRELNLLKYLGLDIDHSFRELAYAGLVPPGEQVLDKHWVNQPPWEFPFQAFEVIRSVAIQEELMSSERQRRGG